MHPVTEALICLVIAGKVFLAAEHTNVRVEKVIAVLLMAVAVIQALYLCAIPIRAVLP